jgi:hypothetical protein
MYDTCLVLFLTGAPHIVSVTFLVALGSQNIWIHEIIGTLLTEKLGNGATLHCTCCDATLQSSVRAETYNIRRRTCRSRNGLGHTFELRNGQHSFKDRVQTLTAQIG